MSSLPTGTVTFLFTDIEGSTKLWEKHPEVMKAVLARHDRLLSEAIETHGGTIVKSRGDGCHAVFETAVEAVAAALAGQLALSQDAWTEIQPKSIRVRMALHTGEAEARDGDYYGTVLNRAARLISVGTGGQTLLSVVTAELVRDTLPDGAAMLDLGEHRLKDLNCPEHIYQLSHPDLPTDFPPLKSLESFPGNLPLQLTSFIGRERELAEVKDLLSRTRLLTLSGSGGAGKTRLALQVAADVLETFADGAWLVELATTTDPAAVPGALAGVLGVQESRDRALIDVLIDYLSDKKMFVVLDNCEHLLTACAELANLLLHSCPDLKILATSREALGVPGEISWRIPSLDAPNPAMPEPLETLNKYESVQLFLDRAKAIRPDFALTDDNAHPVAQICHRLDGIPLAIELATTRIRGMSAGQIADRLDDRFRLLTGGNRTALPRQQTLRTMIDWSFGLLSEPERILLRRLSVFVGSWSLEGCETICAGEGLASLDIMDLLMQLVNKSLVVLDERGNETRYRLLETIRQYAREKLLDSGEIEVMRNRHLDWYVKTAQEISSNPWNRLKKSIVDRIAIEGGNFRSAMEWALDNNLEACLRLGGTLVPMVRYMDAYSDWRSWLETALHKAESTKEAIPPLVRAKALVGVAITCMVQGNNLAAKRYLEESVARLREIGDKEELAFALGTLSAAAGLSGEAERARLIGQESLDLSKEIGDSHGESQGLIGRALFAFYTNDYDTARITFEQSVTIARQYGDRWNVAWPLAFFGKMSLQLGDLADARVQLEESLVLFRELADQVGIGQALTALAELENHDGNSEQALAYYKECMEIWRKVGNRGATALVLQLQGHMALDTDDRETARNLFEQCLAIRRQLDDPREIGGPLEGLAMLAAQWGNWLRAARLLAAANTLRGESGIRMESFVAAKVEQLIATRHEHPGFDEGWNEGKAMNTEQAISYALDRSA